VVRYCMLEVSSDCNLFLGYDMGAVAGANELWVDTDVSEFLQVGFRLSPVVYSTSAHETVSFFDAASDSTRACRG
jgi:hypothetical protein